jgi:SRSO17 transposase
MIDRELYLPERWTADPKRCKAARVAEQVEFRTKPRLARVMLARALDAGVPASWVTADEVYGGNPTLRRWLQDRQMSHVLAVKCTELLEAPAPDRSAATTRTSASSWPPPCRPPSGSPAAPGTAPRVAGCTTGFASSWRRRLR